MHSLKTEHSGAGRSALQRGVELVETRVALVLDDAHCLLVNGRQATRALSCLLELQSGDLVLVAQADDAHCHVLHVLERNAVQRVFVSVPGGEEMALRQPRISLHALEAIDLTSARDASITAATGTLSLSARNLFTTVSENLVQQCTHFVGKAGQYLLEVKHLLKLHGQDALLTAERDIKADAERISMG